MCFFFCFNSYTLQCKCTMAGEIGRVGGGWMFPHGFGGTSKCVCVCVAMCVCVWLSPVFFRREAPKNILMALSKKLSTKICIEKLRGLNNCLTEIARKLNMMKILKQYKFLAIYMRFFNHYQDFEKLPKNWSESFFKKWNVWKNKYMLY